ncbi:rho guanine nucleotide exchange factor 10-like [Lycorma delicatula]|uniref:rho guanine nucleotide exchange factor 10-like n=1 Tax=Lycorma delicatula TaxID=130591 RepID=UPI003F50DA1B
MTSPEPRHFPPPPRRPYLRFPPPPPYPPTTPDYAYAYYEPGPATGCPTASKHTFITRYGTEENIYEEIGQSQLEDEVRYVHSRHLQVLDELNLTVEAMLMPPSTVSSSSPDDNEDDADDDEDDTHHRHQRRNNHRDPDDDNALTLVDVNGHVEPTDDLLCPAACSLDSGFGGSSCGTDSLTRSSQKQKHQQNFYRLLHHNHHHLNQQRYQQESLHNRFNYHPHRHHNQQFSCSSATSPSSSGSGSSCTVSSTANNSAKCRVPFWKKLSGLGGGGNNNNNSSSGSSSSSSSTTSSSCNNNHAVSNSSTGSRASPSTGDRMKHHLHARPDDHIVQSRCVPNNCWDESTHSQLLHSSGSDAELSSGDESKTDGDRCKGAIKTSSLWRRASPDPGGAPSPPPTPHQPPSTPTSQPSGRLSRWFSIRRGSQSEEGKGQSNNKMPLLPEVEEESGLVHRRLLPPSLPPPPPHLSPQEEKRRHIVADIVQSENNYLSSLHRLVNDYKKSLEESSPALLSSSKISTIFYRLPEILQCHTLFRIALAEAVSNWDRDRRIGDVFVASFSKAIVLDIYSGFINNFSVAMDVFRSETGRKTALKEFFKQRLNNSSDRLSFFALMVKPVQRFPQFILFLQDLLHHTNQGHPDRMSLQLALTQLESLAELLNERKREAEQSQAFKELLRAISGKLAAKPIADNNRCLLRQDDVIHLEVNQYGLISKCKNRRWLLLNDLLVCVSVTQKDDSTSVNPSPQRLSLKWSCPITDIQVIENTASPTMSRLLTTPNGSLTSNSSSGGGVTDNLCLEMSQLMHDYQVLSHIADLASTLKGNYEEVNVEKTKFVMSWIQNEIQQKDEQMAWVDSCCLQLHIKGKEDNSYVFQMESPDIRKEWITELRLARLALDPSNSPAWEVPEQELRPSTKMPLFVGAHPVYTSQSQSDVVSGCYYTSCCGKMSYLWVCTTDGVSSNISIAQVCSTTLKPIIQLPTIDARITAMEYVRSSDTVWMGTDNHRLLIYSVADVERSEQVKMIPVSGGIISIRQHCDSVFIALTNGRLLIYRRHNITMNHVTGGGGQQHSPSGSLLIEPEEIELGSEPVSCLLPINLSVYAACGKTVTVLSAITGELQKSFTIQHEHVGGNVSFMAHSGVGLWLSLNNSSTICLYHTETFKHLQDINVASNVIRMTAMQGPVCVTSLMACKGLLWVGTDAGVSLTVPLPRLEGVPIISGRVNVSYHGHTGPVRLMLPLQDPPTIHKRPPSKALACDVYGLYGQLMYVKDYDDTSSDEHINPMDVSSRWSISAGSDECSNSSPSTTRSSLVVQRNMTSDSNKRNTEQTLVTVTGGKGYVNLQQPCCTTITNNAHIILWEMKL